MAFSQANFIPRIWAARLESRLEEKRVFAGLANRNYEGEITGAGDSVRIGKLTTDVTISDYTKDTDLAAPQVMTGSARDLPVDQQKSFNIYIDDIDRAQSRPELMNAAVEASANALANVQDTYLHSVLDAAVRAAPSSQRVAIPGTSRFTHPSAELGQDFMGSLINLKRVMYEANMPETAVPWIVVPPLVVTSLEQLLTGTDRTHTGTLPNLRGISEPTFRVGFTGTAAHFNIYMSTKVRDLTPAASNNNIMFPAGWDETVTLAEQLVELEAYRPERRFGDAVKGLSVYGAIVPDTDKIFGIQITTTA